MKSRETLGSFHNFPLLIQTSQGRWGARLGLPAGGEGVWASSLPSSSSAHPSICELGVGKGGEAESEVVQWLSCFRPEAITFLEREAHAPSEAEAGRGAID